MTAAILVVAIIAVVILFLSWYRNSKSEPHNNEPDVPYPVLWKTGDINLDEKFLRLWEREQYAQLSSTLVAEIARIDDLEPDERELEMLRVLRRNEILCQAIKTLEGLSNPSSYLIEFQGLDIQDKGCRYGNLDKRIGVNEYFTDPDVIPCRKCTAEGRKYFCSIIIRPQRND